MAKANCIILAAMMMEANAIGPAAGKIPVKVIGIGAKILDTEVFKGVERVILAGMGGALDPALNIGEVIAEGPGVSPVPVEVRSGKIYPSDHLISSVEEKQRLFRDTGCVAVDMESHIVRPHCESAGIELLHLRAISDAANEALPERMATWVDEVGEPKMGKVTTDLMFRPALVPIAMRLQANSKIALRNLAAAIKSVVESMGHS